MINISVKNSQNFSKFVKLTGVMKPNAVILQQNILNDYYLASEIIIWV